MFPTTASGRVKSTAASRVRDRVPDLDASTSCPASSSAGAEHRADLALAAEERRLFTPRPPSPGWTRSTASTKRSSLGPIPAADSRAGLEQHAGQLGERYAARRRRSRR